MSHRDRGKQPASAASPSSLARRILNLGGGSTTQASTTDQNPELESFHRMVSDCFTRLYEVNQDHLLTMSWLTDLLTAFGSIHDQFEFILTKSQLHKSPMNNFAADYFHRSLTALNIFNATCDGIARMRDWSQYLEGALPELEPERIKNIQQLDIAKKTLIALASDIVFYEIDTDTSTRASSSTIKRLFGRAGGSSSKDQQHYSPPQGHYSSFTSGRMPASWSTFKNLQKIANYLAPPRGRDVAATNGLTMIVFTMSFVLLFVLWVLNAAIPCQGRSLQIHFKIPGQVIWGEPIGKIHNRIMQLGNGERKNCNGIVREIYQVEKSVRELISLMESVQAPSSYEHSGQAERKVTQLLVSTLSLKRNLDSLDRQVMEIFNKVESFRTKGLAMLSEPNE